MEEEEEESNILQLNEGKFKNSQFPSQPTEHENELLNRILETDNHLQPEGQRLGMSVEQNNTGELPQDTINADDTMINLRCIDNPLHQISLLEKENQDRNKFGEVVMLKSFKEEANNEDELLLAGNPSDYNYIFTDNAKNYNLKEDFTLMKQNSPPDEVHQNLKYENNNNKKSGNLLQQKQERIEMLIDRMHNLIKSQIKDNQT